MTDILPVSAEWLALREGADADARSLELSEAAAGMARTPVVVHDLGSGTGSMMRWLAPLIPGAQSWVLHDWNPALLARAAEAPTVGVEVSTSVGDVAQLGAGDLAGATLVTASALLDVLTAEEVATVVAACVHAGAPVLFTVSVTGRVVFDPPDPGDGVLQAAFNDHQRRTTEGRRLLGPDGVALAADLFREAGWSLRTAASPWRLDAEQKPLVEQWLAGWLAAAVEVRPALAEWAAEYRLTRVAQLRTGALQVTVDHNDLLAWRP